MSLSQQWQPREPAEAGTAGLLHPRCHCLSNAQLTQTANSRKRVLPNAGAFVPGSGGEQHARGRVGDGDDRVLVALEDQHRAMIAARVFRLVGCSGVPRCQHLSRVPKLHRAVLGPGDEPRALGRKHHRQHKVLVALESVPALVPPCFPPCQRARSRLANLCQVPELESLVERPRRQELAVRRKRDRVHRVGVAVVLLQQCPRARLPQSHHTVQRPRRNVAPVWAHRDASHPVLGPLLVPKRAHAFSRHNIPQLGALVAAPRDDEAPVA
mmetsp:Transcript_24681/g.58729  ORF Transcript_24681/g.58729 Transcript_24681/m.58729 type:complete len:269 (+) Transcript_24681:224-1030(+)